MVNISEYEFQIEKIKRVYLQKTEKENKLINVIVISGLLCAITMIMLYMLIKKWEFYVFPYLLVLFCIEIFIILSFFLLQKHHKVVINNYLSDIEDLENTLKEINHNNVNDSLKIYSNINDLGIRINHSMMLKFLISEVFIYCVVFTMLSNTFAFTPKNWNNNPQYRKYMINDLIRQCDPLVSEAVYEYNLYYYSKDEIVEIFGNPQNKNIDFEIRGDNVTYDAYYLYTDSNGCNYWLYIDYQFGKKTVNLMSTDQIIIYNSEQ